MNGEAKKVNKLYNLNEVGLKSKSAEVKNPFLKEENKKLNVKNIKIIVLVIAGIFLTLFLFGAYIFHTYDIDFSDSAFERQDLSDCYIN